MTKTIFSKAATINYSTSAFEVLKIVEALYEQTSEEVKREGNFPNTWGGLNAFKKATTRKVLSYIDLPYTKELGSFVRRALWPEYYDPYIDRALIGLSLQEAIFLSPKEIDGILINQF